jgi:hypothetical protein
MALILADRVRETSTTTGTGALSLAGAVVGYQTFSSAIGNTNTCYYAISNPGVAEWEVGIGTYATSGNTLTRTTVLKSSNANAAVSFSAGTKDVFVTYPATKSVYLDASGNVTLTGTLTANTIGAFTLGGTVAGGGNQLNNVVIGTTTPLAGAFTTLSATGDANLCKTSGNITAGYASSSGTLKLDIFDSSLTSTTIGANRVARIGSNVSGGDCTLQFTDSVVYNSYISAKANHIYIQPATSGTYVADFSSTGLAVTGTLTSTSSNSAAAVTTTTVNSSTGTGAYSETTLGNSLNVRRSGMAQLGSNWTTTGLVQQDGLYLFCNGAGGITINTEAGQPIIFGISSTERARIDSSGLAVTGTLSATDTITPSQTKGIVGTTTNNSAQTGSVGEYLVSTVSNSTVSLVTNTAANITSLSLTAGDWDVVGNLQLGTAATTNLAYWYSTISTSSGTLATSSVAASNVASPTGGTVFGENAFTLLSPTVRISLSATTTVYLVAQAGFTVSTLTAGGTIRARRIR